MLDIKFIHQNPQLAIERLKKRGVDPQTINNLVQFYDQKCAVQKQADDLRNQRNTLSAEIGVRKKKGENIDHIVNRVVEIKSELEKIEASEKNIDSSINEILLMLPNFPDEDVPIGEDDSANKEIKKWGQPRSFDFTPLAHYDLGERLNILDFHRGAKITGTGFILYQGVGALMERALINLMLDTHTRNGYRETFVPFMINSDSLTGTGQLPKFKEDVYHLEGTDYYMNPTAEVPLTNIYREEIIPEGELPISLTAYAPSFRLEAGSYGKDTRGLIRVHQFNKVELVKFCTPSDSEAQHQQMVSDAERILKLLELPYRLVMLSTGDMGFAAAKCYDLEVWLPSLGNYKEISSISNCRDFQARRANIRYRNNETGKPEYVHTLNGSGLAVGRTMAAILENYQQKDGSVEIPNALVPYMNGIKVITPP